ncbi:PHD finger containing protein Phf1 [Dionaea muscipula]
MEGGGGGRVVTCGRWIKRPENVNLVVLGKSFRRSSTKSTIEIFSYDSETTSLSSSPLATCDIEEGEPVSIAVHPTGDEIVCSTSAGDCKLFELSGRETDVKLLAKELPCLQGVGVQKCIAFSIDGSRLASGGADGHLRIFEWPSLRVVLDEPRAHKSFRDMDFSLDSEFLASTSTDGSARIWNANVGIPVTNLRRNSDEKIELCRFSQDGTRPFLFCAVQRGDKSITGVWDMSTWDKIGHKRLLKKPASTMSTSMDGKYLALGSRDGDFCVVEVKKMEIHHWSRRLHPGTSIASLEFCPTQRVVLTTTAEWGPILTKLTVPKDWKEWQLYMLLAAMFLGSAVLFYVFFLFSDSFWNLPAKQARRPSIETFLGDPQASDDAFGPLDL